MVSDDFLFIGAAGVGMLFFILLALRRSAAAAEAGNVNAEAMRALYQRRDDEQRAREAVDVDEKLKRHEWLTRQQAKHKAETTIDPPPNAQH